MKEVIAKGPSAVSDFVIENGFKLKYDHKALTAGYLSRNDVYVETYEGRFGKGYLIHRATAVSNLTGGSKNMHIMEYWIII